MRLRRVEAGVYETLDGRWRIERVDSLSEDMTGRREYVTTSCWTITARGGNEWTEITERETKRECVAALEAMITEKP